MGHNPGLRGDPNKELMPRTSKPQADHSLHALHRRVEDLRRVAARHLGLALPVFRVAADLHGRAAGHCRVCRGRVSLDVLIRFNRQVVEDERLRAHALSEIAPHEVAHAAMAWLAWKTGARLRSHGPEWRSLCVALGGSGDTTHDLPLPRARRHREYEYRLVDGTRVWLGGVRHRRLQSGHTRYAHRGAPIPRDAHTGRVRAKD